MIHNEAIAQLLAIDNLFHRIAKRISRNAKPIWARANLGRWWWQGGGPRSAGAPALLCGGATALRGLHPLQNARDRCEIS